MSVVVGYHNKYHNKGTYIDIISLEPILQVPQDGGLVQHDHVDHVLIYLQYY